jgi:hypothetical protein
MIVWHSGNAAFLHQSNDGGKTEQLMGESFTRKA